MPDKDDDGPIWSRCSIALTCPARSHFQRTLSREKDGARAEMNVTAHQEKEKNEKTKTGKRRARKKRKRKQATDFEEAVCCPSSVVQGQHSEK